jgi:hypothetical protein
MEHRVVLSSIARRGDMQFQMTGHGSGECARDAWTARYSIRHKTCAVDALHPARVLGERDGAHSCTR